MATFQTTVNVSPEDVKILKDQGYSLYAFKAVKASGDGVPTVWFRLDMEKLLTTNIITWQEQFSGYNSTSQTAPETVIVTSNTMTTDLGNVVTIDPAGNLSDATGGIDGAVSFLNQARQPFTVGISQKVGNEDNVLCAFPILGQDSSRVIMPITKILLIFSTDVIKTQTVITKAMSSGAFIDLTGVESREVNFSTTEGWNASGASWMNSIPALSELKPLLITN